MPTEKNDHQNDPWLRVFDSEGICLSKEETLSVPASEPTHPKRQGVWLGTFCPDKRCEAETPTNVI